MTTVKFCDVRALNYCNSGVRAFCKKHHIDYAELVKNGIDAELILSTHDAMAVKAVEKAQKREATK